MSSGADLFVVCKQCGSHVSPYITECPYCGNRLRRRAPKLPREDRGGSGRGSSTPSSLGRLRHGEIPGIRGDARPYVTAALVIATCGMWVAWRGGWVQPANIAVIGPLNGDWWRLITTQFLYISGFYQFTALVSVAIFGTLLERRHGPVFVFALFCACAAGGTLVALTVYPDGIVVGANSAALGLLAAWVVPDLRAYSAKHFYDGDLLGTLAIAAAVLAMPLARPDEASWVAGVVGASIGLLVGAGVDRLRAH